MTDRRLVLDASALVAWFLGEPGAHTIDRLLPFATVPALLQYSAAHPGPRGERLSLGDAQCIAVAERLDLMLVGGDLHWDDLPLTVRFQAFR